ncbi:hypothetical protein NDN08_008179 [Rhodosorus marinus]|uniref:Nucleolar complex protein 2 homolog n=1 Tax=Rhodosorus marinus TaxID=101924 RepID=A0AAV8V004_9RHOD|nr:hypothetical protein NDN08_008179 [Rhodosorus marinus]
MGKRKRSSSSAVRAEEAGIGELTPAKMKTMDVDQLFDAIGSLVARDDKDEGENEEMEEADQGSAEDDDQETTTGKSMKDHRLELEKLKQSDPEFYQYLVENDEDLLKFEEDDEEQGDGEEDDDQEEVELSDDDDKPQKDAERDHVQETLLMTTRIVKSLEDGLRKRPREAFTSAKKLLRAFRSGCHLTETTKRKKQKRKQLDEDEDTEGISAGSTFGGDVKFASPRVYQRVMTVSVVKVLSFLSSASGRKEGASSSWVPDSSSSRWKKVQPLIKSFALSFVHLLDGVTDGSTARFLLQRAEILLPLLTQVPKQGKQSCKHNSLFSLVMEAFQQVLQKLEWKSLIQSVLGIWSSESVNVPTRIRAYLLLHSASSSFPDAYLELALKGMIKSYRLEIGNRCNPRSLQRIAFAVNCISELSGVDLSKTYTIAFVSIRDIAIALRVALLSKGKEELGKVYNWEVINLIRLWGKVLSAYPEESGLRPLIYPYAQVTSGLMRLVPSPRNYGLRFHCARYLIDLMGSSGVYIPVASALLEALNCREVLKGKGAGAEKGRKQQKNGRGEKGDDKRIVKPLDWRCILRVSDNALKSRHFREGVVDQCLLLLTKFLSMLSRSVALPEVAYPTLAGLRRFGKTVSTPAYSKQARQLVRIAEENCQLILSLRARLDFGVKGVADYSCIESPLKFTKDRTPLEEFCEQLVEKEIEEAKAFDSGLTEVDDIPEEESDSDIEEDDKKMEAAADRPLLLKAGTSGPDENGDEEDIVEDLEMSDEDLDEDESD